MNVLDGESNECVWGSLPERLSWVINTGNRTVDALIGGVLLTREPLNVTEVTYSFEQSPLLVDVNGYSTLGEAAINRHLEVFDHVTALTGLAFVERDPNEEEVDLYFTNREGTETAFVVEHLGGTLHVYNPERATPVLGSYTDHLILHELGHALGLEHGHEPGGLPREFQGHSWSLMSYRTHPNTESLLFADSHGPETYMAADIAGLQFLYGANFDTEDGDTTYTVDFQTGEFFVDGEGMGRPNNNQTFRAIWDGGGNDTLDLSDAYAPLEIDLQPGGFTSFGYQYLSYLGSNRFNDDLFAEGNLANPYLYYGNTSSLLENAIGGSSNDVIIGNQTSNRLDGGSGRDVLYGMTGDDELIGGAGNDRLIDGQGNTEAYGDNGRDFILALSGNGNLHGGTGADIIIGGIGDDTIEGGGGDDVLRGEAGSGFIFGGDTLIAGRGDDVVMGGRGADQFVFAPGDDNNMIAVFRESDVRSGNIDDITPTGADFESGVDKIVLSGFDDVDSATVLDHLTDTAAGAVFNAEGTEITFFELSVEDLRTEDFVFT